MNTQRHVLVAGASLAMLTGALSGCATTEYVRSAPPTVVYEAPPPPPPRVIYVQQEAPRDVVYVEHRDAYVYRPIRVTHVDRAPESCPIERVEHRGTVVQRDDSPVAVVRGKGRGTPRPGRAQPRPPPASGAPVAVPAHRHVPLRHDV